MTLMITRTTRWTAIATLLFLGGQLTVPAAWAQAPSMPRVRREGRRPAERSRLPGGSARHSDRCGRTGSLPGGDRERPLAP